LRKATVGWICLIALFASACTGEDSTISRLEGAEPQRLYFGAPPEVQKVFANQMQACWFRGPSAPLGDYQYDTKPAVMETASGLTELQQITIKSEPDSQGFVIQFFPFNENTLISTRNFSLPVELAAKLKRDVETWIFGRGGCNGPGVALGNGGQQGLQPQTSSNPAQGTNGGWAPNQSSQGAWSPEQEAPPRSGGIY